LADLAVEEVMHPIEAFLRTNLITAKAVARHMRARRSGTILTLSTGASRVALPGTLGYGTTGAVIETMTQRLAVELGPSGVRVVCLRPGWWVRWWTLWFFQRSREVEVHSQGWAVRGRGFAIRTEAGVLVERTSVEVRRHDDATDTSILADGHDVTYQLARSSASRIVTVITRT
jgi:NAD(P)-dependent dehydrogenase (short-subunit alcohol dehydrogenase family)